MIELITNEQQRDQATKLAHYECVIEKGMATFIEVGNALAAIQQQKLYSEVLGYKSFEAYCKDRWEMARSTANQLIAAVNVVENVRSCGHILPTAEWQVRPLVKFSAEKQAIIWRAAVDKALLLGKPSVTAAIVEETICEYRSVSDDVSDITPQEESEDEPTLPAEEPESEAQVSEAVTDVVEPGPQETQPEAEPLVMTLVEPEPQPAKPQKFNRTNDNVEWARWTWNPVTGCLHNCPYCLSGDTLILMGDGRVKPLCDLKVGDEIIGAERRETYWHYVKTLVQAHWQTHKPAYHITLADETEIISSADHRFYSGKRHLWKYVTGRQQGSDRRPHLNVGDELLGTGHFIVSEEPGEIYKRGYLAGIIRGDGHLAHYKYSRAGRSHGNQSQFRLALKDREALQRTALYLQSFGINPHWFRFSETMEGIRTHRVSDVIKIESLIRWEVVLWPEEEDYEFFRGFISGIFDAEGSCTPPGTLRIHNTDSELIDLTRRCLEAFEFCVIGDQDKLGTNKPVHGLRVKGGMKEILRFFHTFDPAIRRKLPIEGCALKSSADLRIISIEPMNVILPMYDITTGTGNFIANGVLAHNCYARDIALRYTNAFPTGFEPTYHPDRLTAPRYMKVPEAAATNIGEKNVFVCSMADLWGKWVARDWIDAILTEVRNAPQWNFLFLTKFPARYEEFAGEFPANAWIGTSVDRQHAVARAEKAFARVMQAGHKGIRWLSCEPMLERLTFNSLEMFDWVVVGGASKSTQTPEFFPPIEWTFHLWQQARAADAKFYMKTNLGVRYEIRSREYPGMSSEE